MYTERVSGADVRICTSSGVNRKSSAVRDTVCTREEGGNEEAADRDPPGHRQDRTELTRTQTPANGFGEVDDRGVQIEFASLARAQLVGNGLLDLVRHVPEMNQLHADFDEDTRYSIVPPRSSGVPR